ncbi:MAG TPA: DUF4192 domain-containing protein [Nocardioides sp.]|nr:DUF4192 domain-containing protein [Nocardioides sp.]
MTLLPFPTPDAVPPLPPTPVTFRVRAPEDFFALAPIVIGFEPEESIVMLTFGGRHPFNARTDLPPRRELTPATAAALADQLLQPALVHGVRDLVLLFYSDDEGATARAFRALRRRCRGAGIHLIDALRTDGRRYYPLLTPDGGRRQVGVPYDVADHPFAAEAVVQGRVVHASRAALAAMLDPEPAALVTVDRILEDPDYADDPGFVDRTEELLEAGAWVEALVAGHVGRGTAPDEGEVAELLWLIQYKRPRDAAWGLLRRADAQRHLDFWVHVVRRTPDRFLPPAATLAGWAAWLAGDGALAWTAVDRCRAVDPAYSLAGLLAEALERAVPPELGEPAWSWWAGLADRRPEPPAGDVGPVSR